MLRLRPLTYFSQKVTSRGLPLSKMADKSSKLTLNDWRGKLLREIPKEWHKTIESNSYFEPVLKSVHEQRDQHVPPHDNYIFGWTVCPRDKVRAVVLGLDPKEEATLYEGNGLAFSIVPAKSHLAIHDVPASMRHIYQAINNAVPEEHNLYNWDLKEFSAKSGILLINIAQTIQRGLGQDRFESEYFKNWVKFSEELITTLLKENEKIVILPFYNPKEKFRPDFPYTEPEGMINTHAGYWTKDEIEKWSVLLNKLKMESECGLDLSEMYQVKRRKTAVGKPTESGSTHGGTSGDEIEVKMKELHLVKIY